MPMTRSRREALRLGQTHGRGDGCPGRGTAVAVLEVTSHQAEPQKAAAGAVLLLGLLYLDEPVFFPTYRSYCGKAAERSQPKLQLKHAPLHWRRIFTVLPAFFSSLLILSQTSPFPLLQSLLHANALYPTFPPNSSLAPFHANHFSCFPLSFLLIFAIFIASQPHLGLLLFVYGACWLGSVFIQHSAPRHLLAL